MADYHTPFFHMLARDKMALGVPNRFLSIEAMTMGFCLFVAHAYAIAGILAGAHMAIAALNRIERDWIEIVKLALSLPGEEHARLP